MRQVPDQKARDNALDISKSFIIQAPAGSGKTSLLTQRYLSLLAKVQNPEEIIAITFTKKAAAEMQQRIIEALMLATENEPTESYLKKTYHLALSALKQNDMQKWDLFKNKNRLRILTIDAFCLFLTNKMPLLSKAIPFSQVADDPNEIYRLASIRTLQTAANNKELSPKLIQIQDHLGNNQSQLIELFILMLQKREQWLGHVISARSLNKDYFINVLNSIQNSLSEHLIELLPETLIEILEHIIYYQSAFTNSPLCNSDAPIDWDSFIFLKKLSQLLLSTTGTPRKRYTKKEGFPSAASFKNPEDKNSAKQVKELLTQVATQLEDNPKLVESLRQIKILPNEAYNEAQWEVLSALLKLLPLLAAELSVIFSQTSKVDFNEISIQALQALGDELPTELALYLDYEINHLLIDEFQDTSKKQYKLLERLTESWFEGDGKTLFLVGDPMQSIYRFREADVGLFLSIKRYGINQIKITPLQLTCNFRSSASLINDVNKICLNIFPKQEDIESGAVTYTESETLNNITSQSLFGINANSKQEEAQTIRDYILSNPDEDIAILIRSRSQLKKIAPILKNANIKVEGINLEKLNTTYLINLLLAITKFIIDPQDTLSLCTLLNSPLCGLNTQELEILFNAPFIKSSTVLEQIHQRNISLSHDSQLRLNKIIDIFKHSHHHAYRKNLSEITHDVWTLLQGDLSLSVNQHDDINQFWSLLQKHSKWPVDIAIFERQLSTKYSEQKSKCNVKIMTIHRSKGLEFDTVILPGLDYASSDKNTDLLSWLEINNAFILSPIHSAFDDSDPLVTYIKSIEKQKSAFERQRLFYVALTRAKTKLLLIHSSSSDKKATSGSFLSYLENYVTFSQLKTQEMDELNQDFFNTNIKTLKQDFFQSPKQLSFIEKANDIPKTFKKNDQQIVGEFVHQQLFYISEHNLAPLLHVDNNTYLVSQLLRMGLQYKNTTQAISTYKKCMHQLNDSLTGQWILKRRKDQNNEFKLNTAKGSFIIDRTFIDDDIRWIIDYKISTDLEKNKTEYIEQLNNYGDLFALMESNKIKLMLYYPLLDKSITWQHEKKIADDITSR